MSKYIGKFKYMYDHNKEKVKKKYEKVYMITTTIIKLNQINEKNHLQVIFLCFYFSSFFFFYFLVIFFYFL